MIHFTTTTMLEVFMSASIDARLIGPLQKIAQLAINRAELCQDEDLDLFDLRSSIGHRSKEAIIAHLRREVERLDSRQTVREIDSSLVRRMRGLNNVHCIVCPADTPDGVVMTRLDNTHVFAISGSATGYIPLAYK